MTNKLLPLGVIADMICTEMGDNIGRHKFLLLQYLTLGYQKMYLLLFKDTTTIKSQIFDVNHGTQFELPVDFVYETKLGLKIGDRICPLYLNTDLVRSDKCCTDSEISQEVNFVMCGEYGPPDTYFYNVFYNGSYCCGSIGASGMGFSNGKSYYNISDGSINISPFLTKNEDVQLIIEYKSDGISQGLELVPSECYLPLYYFAKGMFNQEDENGKFNRRWEQEFKVLKRLYNFTKIDIIVDIFRKQ